MSQGEAGSAAIPRPGSALHVAVLLLAIDEELSARVLRALPEEQAARVTRAMQALGGVALAEDTVRLVLHGALSRLQAPRADTPHIDPPTDPNAIFDALSPEDLAGLVAEEHPQIAAVFIAHLDRRKAAAVIRHLPAARRADLVCRISMLDRTPLDVVQRVLGAMRKRAEDLGLTRLPGPAPTSWVKVAAELLDGMGEGEAAILESITKTNDALGRAIREEMFDFEVLARLDRQAMQGVLAQVDTRMLAVALSAASQAVEAAVLSKLSRRAASVLAEVRRGLGELSGSETRAAQRRILGLARAALGANAVPDGVAAAAGDSTP